MSSNAEILNGSIRNNAVFFDGVINVDGIFIKFQWKYYIISVADR